MKKTVSLLLLICCVQMAMAATDLTGHFHVDMSARQIPVAFAEQHFSDYLDLPAATRFVLLRDTVDKMGYRHLSYKQWVDTMSVSGGEVLVHALNGTVVSMNGEILTRQQREAMLTQNAPTVSARQALRRVGRHNAPDSEAKAVWVKVLEGDRYVWHKAYEIRSIDWTRLLYVDIYTGEVVTERSLVYHADVQGTAYTLYNGIRSFTCNQHADGLYYLEDSARNIITLDATHATRIDYSNFSRHTNKDSVFAAYRSTCSPITHTDSIFDWSFYRYLKQVTITALPVWTGQHGDTLPNLYVKIFDSKGTLLQESDTMAVDSFPVTFTIPDGVETKDGRLVFALYHHYIEQDTSVLIAGFVGNQSHSLGKAPISVPNTLEGWIRYVDTSLQPALDVHWGMQQTLDFYQAKFGRHGHDNHGGVIYQFYNVIPDTALFKYMPFNAFAIPYAEPNVMAYGAGAYVYGDTANSINPVVDIDVMAHEFTHLVTGKNGNGGLEYEYESGALNESFSDMMAMGVMQYVFDTCSWTLGSHLETLVSNMRSLSDPHRSKDGFLPQPKYYQGQYWATGTGDYGGVHTNSGVQNYWFYLLCEGGSGTNEAGESFNISGIGIDKGVQIAYLNLIYYLTPNAAYADARWGSEQAAKELYGENSAEYNAVAAAWDAVGVENQPEPTAMGMVSEQPSVSKIIRNGQVLIVRDGVEYDVMGKKL